MEAEAEAYWTKTAFVAEELELVDVRGGLNNRTYRLTDAGVQMRDEAELN